MTSVVGILCEDGAVIATDSAATFSLGQLRTIEQPTDKLDLIGEGVIISGTGSMGVGQRFCAEVERLQSLFTPRTPGGAPSAVEICRQICSQAVKNFKTTDVKLGSYGALLAFSYLGKPYVCEFALADFQPTLLESRRLWYASMGSAQTITDPFLGLMRRVFWHDKAPPIAEAIFAAYWTLEHAVELNPGGVNGPIQMAVLEKNPETNGFIARRLETEELEEHRQNVRGAYEALRDYRSAISATSDLPDPPTRTPS